MALLGGTYADELSAKVGPQRSATAEFAGGDEGTHQKGDSP